MRRIEPGDTKCLKVPVSEPSAIQLRPAKLLRNLDHKQEYSTIIRQSVLHLFRLFLEFV